MTLELRALAKVQVHRHLEGSLRVATIIDLVRQPKLSYHNASYQTLGCRAQI